MDTQKKILVDLDNTAIAFEPKNDKELKETIFLFKMMNKAFLVNIGSKLTLFALKIRLPIQGIIKRTVFKQFCGGTSLKNCIPNIRHLAEYQVATVLDYGAEAKSTEAEFDQAVLEFLKAIQFAAENDTVPVVTCKVTALAKFDLLEKITAKKELSKAEKGAWERTQKRMHTICREAQQLGVAIFIDAEESWIQDAIDELTNLMMANYNKERIAVYNTFQMYRHDRLEYLRTSFEQAQKEGYILGAKLVRGAYMEKERNRAAEHGYPSPIQPNKASSDRDYDAAVKLCVENYKQIASCLASHNKKSTLYQLELMQELEIPKNHPHLNFCQLYGMSDNLTFNLAKAGYNVAKYVPYGPIRDVMPYLIRRAQENSAVGGEVSRELGLLRKEQKRRRQSKKK
ncbi:MAG: proline dehydrogenase family protein [Saprospiraceae bacterium]|nr:proline dehydrogenase family protein [Saprospiraceae bacterium]